MKKLIAIALFISCISIVFYSCDNDETYADKLKKEKKAISSLRQDSGFVFIDEYPANGVFGPKEFYRDPQTGIYMNVIDSGNGNRASSSNPKTSVLVRYAKTYRFSVGDTLEYNNNMQNGTYDYITFEYGTSSTYTSSSTDAGVSNYYFKSPGLVAPLKYVGQNAIVRLIIPFSAGSGLQNVTYEPVYMGHVQYRFQAQ